MRAVHDTQTEGTTMKAATITEQIETMYQNAKDDFKRHKDTESRVKMETLSLVLAVLEDAK